MSAPFLPPFCTVRPPVGTKIGVSLAPDIYRHLNRQIRLAFITWCCTTMDDNSLISKGTKIGVSLAPDIYRHLNRQIRLAFITWCCTTMDDNSLISKEIQPHRRMSLDGAGQL
jgi:hypothetical protein